MKLAVATCQQHPLGVADDTPLIAALQQRFTDVKVLPWDSHADWSEFDACLLRSVWDYHERLDEFNHWVSQVSKQTQLINPAEVLVWNQNKHYLAELADFGITIAPTHWLSTAQAVDLTQLIGLHQTQQFFLKPVVAADSSGTLKFDATSAGLTLAEQHLATWLPQVDMMLQPYFDTVETFGETSAIYFAGNGSHAVRKIPVKGDYRVQDTFGATDVSHRLNASEMALSKACLDYLSQRFGDLVYARFDFLHDAAGCVYLNEAELIEPSLFFSHEPKAAESMAQALFDHLLSEPESTASD